MPHILYLHSGDGDSRNVVPLMHRVKHAASVTAVDMRGFGQSSYKLPLVDVTDLAEDVATFMSERYGGKHEYYVFGEGLGATVAMELTKMAKEGSVRGLVLVDLPHGEKEMDVDSGKQMKVQSKYIEI